MAVNTNTICRKSDNSESRQLVGICYATQPKHFITNRSFTGNVAN
jgi:hypothetical protein